MSVRLAVAAAVAAASLVAAGVAYGVASPVLVSVVNTNELTGSCEGVAGATTDPTLQEITYAIHGQASATATEAGVAGVGTAVTCRVIDRNTGDELGSVGGGLPGPHAEAVGTVVIPIGSRPKLCTEAFAAYSDGTGKDASDC